MRKLTTTSLLLFAFVALVGAQTKKPPVVKVPPPVKLFESAEGGFKVAFPKKPARTARQIQAASGANSIVMYELVSVAASYYAAFTDFPAAVDDEAEIDVRFDGAVQGLIARPGSRLVEQRRIYVGENLGREFTIEQSGFTMTMQCFIVRQRMFQLAVTTRGLVSKSATVKRLHNTKAGSFFDSFEITLIPEAKLKVVELPVDFGVTFDEGLLGIGFFGMEIKIPEEWEVTDEGFNELMIDGVKEDSKSENTVTARATQLSLERTRVLRSFVRSEGDDTAMLIFAAEKVTVPNFVPASLVTATVNTLGPGETLVKRVDKEMIGGIEFAWYESREKDSGLRTRMYVANRRGVALEIAISYVSQKHLDEVLAILKDIKFSEPATKPN